MYVGADHVAGLVDCCRINGVGVSPEIDLFPRGSGDLAEVVDGVRGRAIVSGQRPQKCQMPAGPQEGPAALLVVAEYLCADDLPAQVHGHLSLGGMAPPSPVLTLM
jgi:hypothetical protein